MNRWGWLAIAIGWCGTTLLLGELRWFRRTSLTERVRPYRPGGRGPAPSPGAFSVGSARDVLAPLASRIGERLAHLFGVTEPLVTRLERIHSPMTVGTFRLRQLAWSLASFVATSFVALSLGLPALITLLALAATPLLAFLVVEQQLVSASARWQRRVFLELPVVSEQLGMLLSAGFSLGGAIQRLANRGDGACASDLRRVNGRLQQGLSEVDALREWAELARVDALGRLVAVLSLNRDAGDLGVLISQEARSIRGDAQRELLATIDKRAQQVWIPVTVATLLPGVIFLAVPFIAALELFTNG